MTSFDAVIFDCDGVLVDSEALALDECVAYLKSHGFTWDAPELVRRVTGLRDDIFAERLSDAYQVANGAEPPDGFFAGLVSVRRDKREELQPVRGAGKLLQTMLGPKAIASSSKHEFLEAKLKRTSLWDLVAPHVYSAECVEHGKPAPDIFFYAAERLGAQPSNCLVIEDSRHGVAAGVAAGMTVWGFLGGGHCFDGHGERLLAAGATRLVKNFDELTTLL